MTVYGYARISTPRQDITRQIRNMTREYEDIQIIQEVYTGTTEDRPKWDGLKKRLKAGDVLVFDSISRMSRNANEGFRTYMELYDKGIDLRFIKQPYVDSRVYSTKSKAILPRTDTSTDIILKGIEDYIREIAREQIKLAFQQSELEVTNLRIRTSEGMKTAKDKGKQIGRQKGVKVETVKAKKCKRAILQMSRAFKGDMQDKEVIDVLGISHNTFYKYKKELQEKENAKTNRKAVGERSKKD